MFTTSTPALRRAVNDAAGERKWKFLPGTGAPRSLIAVSRLTTVKSAPDSTGASGANTWSGSALTRSDSSGSPVEAAPTSVSWMSTNWVSPAKANVTGCGPGAEVLVLDVGTARGLLCEDAVHATRIAMAYPTSALRRTETAHLSHRLQHDAARAVQGDDDQEEGAFERHFHAKR